MASKIAYICLLLAVTVLYTEALPRPVAKKADSKAGKSIKFEVFLS